VAQEVEEFMSAMTTVMTASDILAHPAIGFCVRGQAQALLRFHRVNPRTASPFATQQRWLMAQAALAAYFRNEARCPGIGLLAERFVDLVARHDVASRNTAAAFFHEMLKYGVVRHVAASAGRRYRPVEPSPATRQALLYWLTVHLTTLDRLDNGVRLATLKTRPAMLATIQPSIADGLLTSRIVREPAGTFSLFTWVNDGGIVMDRLIAGCPHDTIGRARLPTDIKSVSSLAQGLNLSRSQLSRKFAAAEAMGSLGWSGARGRSALWVSGGFVREYHAAQAVKLAIIDAAFAAAFAYRRREPAVGLVALA
jgi:AraC-like DNA-binding protein